MQDEKMQFKESLLPKNRSQTVAKNGTLQKCLCPKSETNSVRSKNAAYKNDGGQKIGAKQLKIKNGTL